MNIASVYAALKNEAKSIEWLEAGLKDRDPNLTWINFDREFRFLDRKAQFQSILNEVGLSDTTPIVTREEVSSAKGMSKLFLWIAILIALLLAGFALLQLRNTW